MEFKRKGKRTKKSRVSEKGSDTLMSFRQKKKLRLKRAYPKTRILIFGSVALISTVIISAVIYLAYPKNTGRESIEDEAEKNRLLMSSKTDFLIPVSPEKLSIREHRVQKGETLGGIAKKYGVSVDTVCGSNNLTSYDLVSAGTLLKIPNREGILYKIEKGVKLSSLAQKYKISIAKILDENDIKNPDFLSLGTVIFIPDAKPQNMVPGFLWPVYSRMITCGYGWRRNPFDRKSREFHHGLDIRANYESVRSTKYGQVTYAGWLGSYGYAVIVAHPGGWKSLYAHLSKIHVRVGQYVKQGQIVARSGNTGRSTGAHLHFEIIKNGAHKNPYYYLRRNG